MSKNEKGFKYPKPTEICSNDGKTMTTGVHVTNHEKYHYVMICEIHQSAFLNEKGAWDCAKQYLRKAFGSGVCIEYSESNGQIRLYAFFPHLNSSGGKSHAVV